MRPLAMPNFVVSEILRLDITLSTSLPVFMLPEFHSCLMLLSSFASKLTLTSLTVDFAFGSHG